MNFNTKDAWCISMGKLERLCVQEYSNSRILGELTRIATQILYPISTYLNACTLGGKARESYRDSTYPNYEKV
jgi:hypothetical protein